MRIDGKCDAGNVVVGGSGEVIAAVNTLPSLIELEPEKFADYLKEKGLTHVIAWLAEHSESALTTAGPRGFDLEIRGRPSAATLTDGFGTVCTVFSVRQVRLKTLAQAGPGRVTSAVREAWAALQAFRNYR